MFLSRSMLELIGTALQRMGVPDPANIVVGFSGGKDSLTLTLALRELGFEAVPVIIDMGYKSFDAQAVASTVRGFGFQPVIIPATARQSLVPLSPKSRVEVESHLTALASDDLVTPCGACSRTKRLLLLAAAEQRKISFVSLGHHRDDFVVTILKDYFLSMYHDAIGEYDSDAFSTFIRRQPIDGSLLVSLIRDGRAATMPALSNLSGSVKLVRPLMFVSEAEIRNTIRINTLQTHGSGCSHAVFTSGNLVPVTKREIVHAELSRRLRETPLLGDELMQIALLSLQPNGRARYPSPRANRDASLPHLERKLE